MKGGELEREEERRKGLRSHLLEPLVPLKIGKGKKNVDERQEEQQ